MIAYSVIAILISFLISSEGSPQGEHILSEMIKAKGCKYVTLITGFSHLRPAELTRLYTAIRISSGTYLAMSSSAMGVGNTLVYRDFSVFIISRPTGQMINWEMILTQIESLKVESSMIFCPDPLPDSILLDLKETLKRLQMSSIFYLLCASEPDQLDLYNVITLKNVPSFAMNKLKFHSQGHFKDVYDLAGMQLISSSLTLAPYLILENCNDKGDCDSSGYLIDVTDQLAARLNFTYVSRQDPEENWGVQPISGPFNKTGIWGGSMGDVINGDVHFSLSMWIWNIERQELMDFLSVSRNFNLAVLTLQPPSLDTGLFIRPFTEASWHAIIVIIVLILASVLLPYLCIPYFEDTTGYQVATLSSWYFFVLMNAFYGGALTMFFTSESSLPFDTLTDAMRAYPTWKLMYSLGDDVFFQYRALQGDPDYSAFWNRAYGNRELTFHSIKEGLERIANGRYIMYVGNGQLKNYFRENPFHQQNLKTFAPSRPNYNALIFTENSPVKVALEAGLHVLREGGVLDQLLAKWEGKPIMQSSNVETMVLSPGQVILGYIVMGSSMLAALAVFAVECCWKWIYKQKRIRESLEQASIYGQESKNITRNIITLLKYSSRRQLPLVAK